MSLHTRPVLQRHREKRLPHSSDADNAGNQDASDNDGSNHQPRDSVVLCFTLCHVGLEAAKVALHRLPNLLLPNQGLSLGFCRHCQEAECTSVNTDRCALKARDKHGYVIKMPVKTQPGQSHTQNKSSKVDSVMAGMDMVLFELILPNLETMPTQFAGRPQVPS